MAGARRDAGTCPSASRRRPVAVACPDAGETEQSRNGCPVRITSLPRRDPWETAQALAAAAARAERMERERAAAAAELDGMRRVVAALQVCARAAAAALLGPAGRHRARSGRRAGRRYKCSGRPAIQVLGPAGRRWRP